MVEVEKTMAAWCVAATWREGEEAVEGGGACEAEAGEEDGR